MKPVAEELRRLDRRLAETHGAYFGFRTEAGAYQPAARAAEGA